MMPADRHELKRLSREIQALAEIAKILASPLEMSATFSAVMTQVKNAVELAEFGVLWLWDETGGLLRPKAVFGYDFETLNEISLRTGEALTGKVYDTGQAKLLSTPDEVAQATADLRPANGAALVRARGSAGFPLSALAAPLRVNARKFGVLGLEVLHGPERFAEADLSLAQTLADLIALGIDRARLEAEMVAFHNAHKADRLRSEAMATLSHELRTPLASIKGYVTALLLDEVEWPDEKRREFLRLIDEECDDLLAMIGDMLDSALIDVGHLEIEPEPLRLLHLAREVSEDMQRHTALHRLVADFPAAFPLVDADPRRIRQVLRNVLDNAIKYSPDGGLVVIRGEARSADVVISVSDQGVGIAPENLIPLFEKYFRVKSPTGFHVPGTGLGLPVARAIVEAHGGRMWAESRVGRGTTLYFSLPHGGSHSTTDE